MDSRLNASIDQFFRSASNRRTMGHALPDGAIVQFDLEGTTGPGSWTLRRIGDRVDLLEQSSDRPDCHVRCSAEDFRGLIDGSLDPQDGYLSGRLQVTGDVGIVLDLRRAVLES